MRKKFILQTYKNFCGFGGLRPSYLKVAGFRVTEFKTTDLADDWQNKVLWVNYRAENNVYERKAMESMGLEFTLVLSTDEALHARATINVRLLCVALKAQQILRKS